MNTSLITIADVREFKGISSNINVDKDFFPHVLEAQEFDLRAFLGESFYIDLVEDFEGSPSLDLYSDLFNGVKYTYSGQTYEHSGLKAVLVYHSYARYLSYSGVQSTPTGMMQKLNQYSEKVDDKTLARLIQQARSGATAHEVRVTDFLNRNASSYPLWKSGCTLKNDYKTGLKIRKIG